MIMKDIRTMWENIYIKRLRAILEKWRTVIWKKMPRNMFTRACYAVIIRIPLCGRLVHPKRAPSAWPRYTPFAALNPPLPLSPLSPAFSPEELDIHWVIPGPPPAGGGHMTIFRMAHFLERFGHKQTIWVQDGMDLGDEKAIKALIRKNYFPLGDAVHIRFLPDDVRQMAGDILIATDCWTAYPVSRATFFKERFYFIQDYEPAFHPMGANWLTADATYDFGFSALCAGAWLESLMRDRGLWVMRWDLSADRDIYYPSPPAGNDTGMRHPPRIAFYSRPHTARRSVELGYAAFELLVRRGRDFVVDVFGEEDQDLSALSFAHTLHGILPPAELAELYRSSDVGVVFSATNYSLVPLEMAACGLPVVDLDVPSVRAVFTNDEVTYAKPTPHDIADALEALLDNQEKRRAQIENAYAYLDGCSWENSARSLEAAFVERLKEKKFQPIDPEQITAPVIVSKRKVSVFIPTFNAGPGISDVLESLVHQHCDFAYDILLIDSGSTDDTLDRIDAYRKHGVRLEHIDQSAFQHGRTRNLGISMTDGEYVALLTQDARPKNAHWLSRLIAGFSHGKKVAGVTGRHEAYPEHGPLAKRDMDEHFAMLCGLPSPLSLKHSRLEGCMPGDTQWRMLTCFYSDNNSALSRNVWKVIPYPEIAWGEDQVWADMILKAGFEKAYVHDAVVYHSHAFDDARIFKTAVTEGEFWANFFGIRLVADIDDALAHAKKRNMEYAKNNNIPDATLERHMKSTEITLKGRYQGWLNAKTT